MKPKVIKSWEKKLVFGVFIVVDGAQLLLIESIVVGTIIDIIAGLILIIYASFRRLWTRNKFLTLIATYAGEAIPFINALPFWTFDVANLYSGTTTTETQESEIAFQNPDRQPLYGEVDGVVMRAPQMNTPTSQPIGLNSLDGIRPPRGGLPFET